MASMALRAALLLLAAACAHASSCTTGRGARGVEGLDPRRYAGDWYQQAAWGTGARAMSCLKTVYTADPAPGVVLGVATSFRTPYGNELTLRGVKRAPNASRPSELLVFPDTGPGLRVEPTPSWVVAVGDGPDYGWAATAAGPPSEASEHGCLPRERTGGLAILTRERAPNAAVLRQAKAALAMRGYDTSDMVPTRQDNCARL